MYKIGVVGEKDAVIPFLTFGFSVVPITSKESAAKEIDRMAKEGFGLIFVTETFGKDIPETIERYKKIITPAVILIPGSSGSLGIGLKMIKDNVEKAAGINILK